MKPISLAILLCLFQSVAFSFTNSQQILDFPFEGNRLNGILDLPSDQPVKGIVLIVHGYGRTNAITSNMHYDVRQSILKAGYGTYMWDKMGCGNSEGEFDINQPVDNSADEAIAAIDMLRKEKIPGSANIGLWGVSRAGWINPIVIQKQRDIRFWISISGTDAYESWGYLLKENLQVDGSSAEQAQKIYNQWAVGNRIVHQGGSFEEFLDATVDFRNHKFVEKWNNGQRITRFGYYQYQKEFQKKNFDYDKNLELIIPDFDQLLHSIEIPVLAVFGEKDKHVDWQSTLALYNTAFENSQNLTVLTFPNANHNLYTCQTGGFYEFENGNLSWDRPIGYLNQVTEWLISLEKP